MGRGNYNFGHGCESIPTYYVEFDGSDLEQEFAYDDFKYEITRIKGLVPVKKHCYERCEFIVAENGILEVRIADNESTLAIACVPKLNEHGRRNPKYEASANRIFHELAKNYRFHVATSAWTSKEIKDGANYTFY